MSPTCTLALAALAGPFQAPEPTVQQLPVLSYWTQPYLAEREEQSGNLLHRIVRYSQANHSIERAPRIYTTQFERRSTMHWFGSFESLKSALAHEQSVSVDEGWGALLDELDELLEGGALERSYLFPLGGGHSPGAPAKFYRWVRVSHTFSPKAAEARRFARDLADYLEAGYPEIDARAYSADLQAPDTIYWFVDYDDLTAWEAVRARLLADDGYLELMARASGLFVEEDVRETMLLDSTFDPEKADPFNLGIHLKDRGDYAGAIVQFRRAVELDPADVVALNWVGVCLGKLGDREGKIAVFRRVLEIDPDYDWSLLNLGTALAEDGDYEEAVELYRRAIAAHPRFMQEHFAREHTAQAAARCAFVEAMARGQLADEEGARAAYDRAIRHIAEVDYDPQLVTLRALVEQALGIDVR